MIYFQRNKSYSTKFQLIFLHLNIDQSETISGNNLFTKRNRNCFFRRSKKFLLEAKNETLS